MATPTATNGEFVTRKQAARYLTERGYRVSPRTLSRWASKNNSWNGPAFYQAGWSSTAYKKEDLDTWLAKNLIRIE